MNTPIIKYSKEEASLRDAIAVESLKIFLQQKTHDMKKLPEIRQLTVACYQLAGAMITARRMNDDGSGE